MTTPGPTGLPKYFPLLGEPWSWIELAVHIAPAEDVVLDGVPSEELDEEPDSIAVDELCVVVGAALSVLEERVVVGTSLPLVGIVVIEVSVEVRVERSVEDGVGVSDLVLAVLEVLAVEVLAVEVLAALGLLEIDVVSEP